MPQSVRRRPQDGSTTAEYAIGVVAVVLVAALLLQLVLDGFFAGLLQTLFERGLDVVQSALSAGASAFSLTALASGAWSSLTDVAAASGGWAVDIVSDTIGDVGSGVSSAAGWARSGLASAGSTALDAASGALRWAGGPISEVVR